MSRTILYLSKGIESASTRYRALQFFAPLRQAGYYPLHMPLSGGAINYLRALRHARKADAVIVLRKTLPLPLLWLLRKQTKRLVFELDDAIFCNSDGSPSSTRMTRFIQMIRRCDHVIAGNRFLANTALPINAAVSVLPTCVDADKYAIQATPSAEFFDVVWIGSSSTRKYLEAALPGLRLAHQAIPQLRLKVIADFDLPDAGLPCLAIPWRADTEVQELATAHVGIAPMINNDWTRGKCALKVLQYFAANLPVVCSPAGVNAEIVTAGENGEFASSPSEWAQALQKLASDPTLRQRYASSGRALVIRDFSRSAALSKLTDTLNSLIPAQNA